MVIVWTCDLHHLGWELQETLHRGSFNSEGAKMKKLEMSVPALVFFIAVIVLGITDLGFVLFGGVGESLSAWIVARTLPEKAVPYFPPLSMMIFTLGCVAGHLLFGLSPTPKEKKDA